MTNQPIPSEASTAPLSAETAFVVHVTTLDQDGRWVVGGRIEHINSGRALRFASVAELLGFMRQIIALLVLLVFSAPPAWSRMDSTCLTGNDPTVLADAGQIAALDDLIKTVCPCAEYDGSEGKSHRDYVRCTGTQVKAASKSGALRSKCKGRVKKAYARSTCGYAEELDAVACIERSARGKVGCRVMSAETCVDTVGRYTRVACATAQRCIDAGDDNGDYLVDSSDSSECQLPEATITPTATATATATATEFIDDTATPTPMDTSTATPTNTDSPTAAPTPTQTPTGLTCSLSQPPVNRVTVNPLDEVQSVILPPDPRINQCAPQQLLGGGCAINGLDGSVENFFDARPSTDSASCDPEDPTLSYHWELFKPPGLSGVPYSSNGITGYQGPVLTILPNSLPELAGTDAGQDINWRVKLTVTSSISGLSSVAWFRFQYQQSQLTLQMSTNCQRIGQPQPEECHLYAENGFPATEPTGPPPTEIGWTFCGYEGQTCHLPGNRTVRFGADGSFYSTVVAGTSVPCTVAHFGDPLLNTSKHCAFALSASTPHPR